jgi:superfamily II DNA/RNA helicase
MNTKMTTFSESDIDKRILKAIGEMGFEAPMPVQQQVIPFLLHQKRDLVALAHTCLLYTSPSPRDGLLSRMPSSA